MTFTTISILKGLSLLLLIIFWNLKLYFHFLYLRKTNRTTEKNYVYAVLNPFPDLDFGGLIFLRSPFFYSKSKLSEARKAIIFSILTLISFILSAIVFANT